MGIDKPTVQSLFLEIRYNGTTISSGTGFVYSKHGNHFLITNRHNVTGLHQETNEPLVRDAPSPNEIAILHNKRESLGHWVFRSEQVRGVNDEPLWYEHPTYGPKVDVVALRLSNLDGVTLYSYDEYDNAPKITVHPADAVSVVGFPFGMAAGGAFAIWATGFIASEPSVDLYGLPLMLIDCRGRPGQSGSPVIAFRSGMITLEDGTTGMFQQPIVRPLGVYSGRITAQSDLGMVWKIDAVRQIVEHAMKT
jgi:V8-like Glu-specific endopeptidase